MNTRKSHKMYKKTAVPPFKNLISAVSSHLNIKYFEDFNFYFAKSVNEILANIHSPDELRFKDYVLYDFREEIMRRYYNTQESEIRLSNYAAYYAELEDYLVPHYEIHNQRKLLFKRRKRKYKLKSRQIEPSRINQSTNRIKKREELLGRLDKNTVYLEDVNVSNTITMIQNETSSKIDIDYRLEYVKNLEFNEVHDIYDPVFSSEDEDYPQRPTFTTLGIDNKVNESVFLNTRNNDSIITKLSEFEDINKSKINNLKVSSDSLNFQVVETLELLSPKILNQKYNLNVPVPDFKKRKHGIETEVNDINFKLQSSEKKIQPNKIENQKKIKKTDKKVRTTELEKEKLDGNLRTALNFQFDNKILQNFVNFTVSSAKNATQYDKLFKTNDDNIGYRKTSKNRSNRNSSVVKNSQEKQNNLFKLTTFTQRNSKIKSLKYIGLQDVNFRNKTGSSPLDLNTPQQYLMMPEIYDYTRKTSTKNKDSECMIKLSLKNKKLFLATKTKTDDTESKPTLSLSSYVKSLLQKNKNTSCSNTLTSFKNKDFISKLNEMKKNSTMSQYSKGVFSTFKEESVFKTKDKEVSGNVKKLIVSNSTQKLKNDEKILPEHFYHKTSNNSKKRSTSSENQVDEYSYYQSVKRKPQKQSVTRKNSHKIITNLKGSLVPNRKKESTSNSRSISTQRIVKLPLNSLSLKNKLA